jgi:hypothetical protein
MDNAKVHMVRAIQEKLDVSRFKRRSHLPYSLNIVSSDFFPSDWLRTQLERREYNGEKELYEAVDEILTGLSIKMIKTVFVGLMNRLERLIYGNGDHVS